MSLGAAPSRWPLISIKGCLSLSVCLSVCLGPLCWNSLIHLNLFQLINKRVFKTLLMFIKPEIRRIYIIVYMCLSLYVYLCVFLCLPLCISVSSWLSNNCE